MKKQEILSVLIFILVFVIIPGIAGMFEIM